MFNSHKIKIASFEKNRTGQNNKKQILHRSAREKYLYL